MVSLEQLTPGLMQPHVLAEIDPGPSMGQHLDDQLPKNLRIGAQLMEHMSTIEPKSTPTSAQRPAEQELEHISAGQREPTRDARNGSLARGAEGSHRETKEPEGGITFACPQYSCPFAMRPLGAVHMEKAHGTWMDLRMHLVDRCGRRRQTSSLYAIDKGSGNNGAGEQATSRISPDIVPLPAHVNAGTAPIGTATGLERGGKMLLRLSGPVEISRGRYESVVIDPGHLDAAARSGSARARENVCGPQGRQEEWLDTYPLGMKQAADELCWPNSPASNELGNTFDGGDPAGMRHLIFGRKQHTSERDGLGGTSLANANVFLGAKETCGDNVNKTDTWHLTSHELKRMVASLSPSILGLRPWPAGPQTNCSVGAADISMRDILMWMIEYNLIASPSETKPLAHSWDQSTQLLINLVAAAISCFHVHFSAVLQRTDMRAKQCTGTVHCLLEDPG